MGRVSSWDNKPAHPNVGPAEHTGLRTYFCPLLTRLHQTQTSPLAWLLAYSQGECGGEKQANADQGNSYSFHKPNSASQTHTHKVTESGELDVWNKSTSDVPCVYIYGSTHMMHHI